MWIFSDDVRDYDDDNDVFMRAWEREREREKVAYDNWWEN